MPIQGLTTQVDLAQGLPLVARLHKGDEKPEKGNRPGKDLDYFRVTFEPQFEHLKEVWLELYGPEPDYFEKVILTAPTVDTAFATWKEEWTATTMLHRCDGESQVLWYSKQTQMYNKSKKACEQHNVDHPCACKATGRLNLILLDFLDATNILGTILVTTTSINDILTVYRHLAAMESLYGTLTNIPFVFGRADKDIRAPKFDKESKERIGRMNVTQSLFYLHVHPDFNQDKIIPMLKEGNAWFKESSQQMAMQPGAARQMLNSGGEKRLGMRVAETVVEQPRVEAIPAEEIPIHPDPTPLTRLSDTLKANGLTIDVAAKLLDITDTENMDEWRKHGKTPNEIADKVQELQAKDKPNPFSKKAEDVKTITGTVVDESQKAFDALPSEKDKEVVQPTLDGMPPKRQAS